MKFGVKEYYYLFVRIPSILKKERRKKKMRCPKCEKENPAGAKFCSECGSSLIPESRMSIKPKWYFLPPVIILFLIFLPPVGIVLMWAQTPKTQVLGKTSVRIIITILGFIWFLGMLGTVLEEEQQTKAGWQARTTPVTKRPASSQKDLPVLVDTTLLLSNNIQSKTQAKDLNGDGRIDLEVIIRATDQDAVTILGSVAGVIVGVDSEQIINWAEVRFGNEHWGIDISSCRKCFQIQDRTEMGYCIMSALTRLK